MLFYFHWCDSYSFINAADDDDKHVGYGDADDGKHVRHDDADDREHDAHGDADDGEDDQDVPGCDELGCPGEIKANNKVGPYYCNNNKVESYCNTAIKFEIFDTCQQLSKWNYWRTFFGE